MAIGIGKVTPTVVKRWRDAFIGLFGGLIPFAGELTPMLHLTNMQFTTLCAIGILLSHFGAKLCGLEDEAGIDQLQAKIDQIKKKQATDSNIQRDA